MPHPRLDPLYDSEEFLHRWFSKETVESIAYERGVNMRAVQRAAEHRGLPLKSIAKRMTYEEFIRKTQPSTAQR